MEITIGRKLLEESKRAVKNNLKKKRLRAEIKREYVLEKDWSTINPQHINSYGIQRKDF